jgi:hypothetical protein
MKNKFILKARELTHLGDQFIQKYGSKNFHKKAKDLLSEQKMHEYFDYKELVETAFSKKFNPRQNFRSLEFSDLPLTIARGEDCFIDVYFWRRRPTVIHNHHFRGAFQCLLGLNVDSEFKFTQTTKLTKFHSLGNLELQHMTTLSAGEIKAINFQDKFIHQNHHQANLTVNLCFRTPDEANKNLSNFYYSGLKFEKDQLSLARAQRLFAFTRIDDFDFRKLELSLEDAFNFLLMSHGSSAANPRFIFLKKFLESKLKKETGVNMGKLLKEHDQELDRLEAQYE